MIRRGLRVMVTGGAGFVGHYLTQALLDVGHDVVVVDDLRVTPLMPIRARHLRTSVGRLDPHDLEGIDLVYHLASDKSVPESFTVPLSYLGNVTELQYLLALAQEVGTPGVLVASSCEAYGTSAGGPNKESDPLNPRSPYACSKVAMEMVARAYQAQRAEPMVSILRLFNVYGPGERPDALVPRFCAEGLRGRPLPIEGSGRQRRDLSYIDDVVAKLTLLSRGALPDVLNIGSGTSTSVLAVAEIVGRMTENSATIQMAARPNEIQEFIAETTLQHQIVGEMEPSVSLEEGIERTVRWWARSSSSAGLGFPA